PGHEPTVLAGDYSARATPVPIPNTVVKPRSADGTAGETRWESTTSPAYSSTTLRLPLPAAGAFSRYEAQRQVWRVRPSAVRVISHPAIALPGTVGRSSSR